MSPTTRSRRRTQSEAPMGKRCKAPLGGRSVSASELAQMGRCERLVVFEHLHGRRRTDSQQRDRKRGLLAHQMFEQEGLDAMSVDVRRRGRCFIATCVFGEAWQTEVLRRVRDVVRRPKPWGRWLIRLYYRTAPGICAVLCRWPVLQRPVRVALGLIAVGSRWWLRRRGDDE
jgi:hypothetical protein